MTHIIYMAAGNSRRFGSNKLLHIWHGKKIYRHTLDRLLSIKQKHDDMLSLTVVTQYEEIVSDLDDKKEINVVFCEESRFGASYTIKAGINSIKTWCKKGDHLMFVVADQPYLNEDTIYRFMEAADKKYNSGYEVFSAKSGDTVGNPCMFGTELISELLNLEGDSGGRKVVKRHKCFYIESSDRRELYDIDKLQDLDLF